jgi:hypothetical protein
VAEGLAWAERTRTGNVTLRDDGLVEIRIDEGVFQSLADARENLDATIRACGGRRRPFLVDISRAKTLEPEVRHFYTGERLLEGFLAMGLLVEASPFGRMMGNIYFRVAKPGIPTRLFTDQESALQWLRTFLL